MLWILSCFIFRYLIHCFPKIHIPEAVPRSQFPIFLIIGQWSSNSQHSHWASGLRRKQRGDCPGPAGAFSEQGESMSRVIHYGVRGASFGNTEPHLGGGVKR